MMREAAGICWPRSATVGHITVTTPLIRGSFPAQAGNDAVVCCDIIPAGKYRNGAPRCWCRTHQVYWGVKADLADLALHGMQRCAQHAAPMAYVLDPPRLHPGEAVPAHARHAAIALVIGPGSPRFDSPDIVQVNLTPPAVIAMRDAAASGLACGCVSCARCGHPHLDLGAFAQRAHQRHTCGHCGHDATHSGSAIVSNPLFLLLQHDGATLRTQMSGIDPDLVL